MTGRRERPASDVLTGAWLAAPADDELRRVFAEPDLKTIGWHPIDVPSRWQDSDEFADSDGPVLYRHAFDAPAPEPGERAWLSLDGLCYQGDVWLDGAYLGDTEGYFFPQVFEVTDALAERTDHLLAVDVTCAPQDTESPRRNLTGSLQAWPDGPDRNPGGLWREVRLERTGPARLDQLRTVVLEADEDRAILRCVATVVVTDPGEIELRTLVDISRDRLGHGEIATIIEEHQVASGENTIEWRFAIENPDLWWPWSLGDQPLYDLRVELYANERLSHVRKRRTGLRRFELRNWVARINGERLFLKGTNVGPNCTSDDLVLAKAAGLDLVRLNAHIAHPELYRAADRLGILIWQDLPLYGPLSRGIRSEAARQAVAAVDVLGHHPSVAIWCGHEAPLRDEGRLIAHELPSWNKSVLDRSVKRAIEKADGSRPVIAHSGVLPHPPKLDGTDSHLWYGWRHGNARDLDAAAARVPRMVRFVSEFGAQAIGDDVRDPTSLDRPLLLDRVPPTEYLDADHWRSATQRYQAELVKHYVETLRRLKYRPTGGFAQYLLVDNEPSSYGVFDAERRPKPAYEALTAACAPVLVVATRPPATVLPGEHVRLAVHVISDLREQLVDASVTAVVSWVGDDLSWSFQGDIEPDACSFISTLEFEVPPVLGPLDLDLALDAPGCRITNRYRTRIVATQSR